MADGLQYVATLTPSTSGAATVSFVFSTGAGASLKATNIRIISDATSDVYVDFTGANASTSASYKVKANEVIPIQAPWHNFGWTAFSAIWSATSTGSMRVFAVR